MSTRFVLFGEEVPPVFKTLVWGIPAHLLGLIAFLLLAMVYLVLQGGRAVRDWLQLLES